MDFWQLSLKGVILVFILLTAYISGSGVSPWYILAVLLYFCANITIHIVQHIHLKSLFTLISVAMLVMLAMYLETTFWLLLPMNLYELTMIFFNKTRWLPLFIMLIPLAFLPHDIMMLYGFIALFSYMFHSMLRSYESKLSAYTEEREEMRIRMDHLSKSLTENSEFIKQSEYTFKLEERNRLSQEIHDKIGHSITGALIQMEASKRLLQSDSNKAAELLQNAILLSKDGIEHIRQVLKNMKPPTEQLGVNRMKLLIDEFSSHHAIQTVFTHDGNADQITPIQWKVILENTKEALTNVSKYSRATFVTVRIEVLNTLIKVVVADNGRGTNKIIKGLGIIGMEERTAELNGTVIVDGSDGFKVTTLLPYRQP